MVAKSITVGVYLYTHMHTHLQRHIQTHKDFMEGLKLPSTYILGILVWSAHFIITVAIQGCGSRYIFILLNQLLCLICNLEIGSEQHLFLSLSFSTEECICNSGLSVLCHDSMSHGGKGSNDMNIAKLKNPRLLKTIWNAYLCYLLIYSWHKSQREK